ncbi:threonine-phosphate decarboxylase CobD [Martelella alba]|uniref:threonine-phosphate decarboxylase n=1 Tax=Martelella alba TaxID=2590451 RepID=A0ABY2SQ18_9HYPH|nr:threonine-phosphate decarboxylase CobD [Martelella alba]TKI08061.1 threonine-phosphate decarboxylase [Martelella alba]
MTEPGQHGGNTLEMAIKLGLNEGDLLDFSANINPLGMPASLEQALAENLRLAERYPDPHYRRLHQRLARQHNCPESWILAGNGATELIFDLACFLRRKTVLLLTPGFAEYRRALQWMECRIEDYPLSQQDDFCPDERLLAALRPGIDCLFLCSPNNPTGQLVAPDLLERIADRCRVLEIMLVVDEAFMDFVPTVPSLIDSLANRPRVFVLRSLTKFYAIAGLRLGYLVSSDVQAMAQLRQRRPPWTINAFAALAGERVLDDQAYHRRTLAWLSAEQAYLLAGLRAMPDLRVWPPAANYLFFRCLRPGRDLQGRLLQHRLLIRSCANYPGLDGDYYRTAVRGREDNRRLLAALERVLSDG